MNFSAVFINRPVATSLLSMGLALAGVLAYVQLPVAPLPQVDFPTISVSASLPGASPETMAATVATPLERVLGNIAGVTEMTSSSSQGSTRVTLQFELNRNVNGAARDVQAAINTAQSLLPTGMPSRPTYKKSNPADSPMLILALTSDTYSRGQMYDLASTTLAQRLAQVDGVGQVSIGGGALPAVRIELDPNKLAANGVSLEMVRQAVVATNAHRPKGVIEDPHQAWQIEANDQARSAQDYAPLILRYVNGQALRLQDVAQVLDSVQDLRTDGVSQGQAAVLLVLNLQPGGNVIEAVDRVRALLPMLQSGLPAAVTMTVVSDRSPTVRASLLEIQKSLVLSMALVILVVALFLKRWQTALIPAVALPLSLAGTCVVMYLMGLSLNNLTLMALTIATGFVVDDAIVVLENITRLRERGMPLRQACFEGSREIGFTVVAISISLVAVFIPILFMGGVLGRLFREFAVVMTAAILISMLVSLTTTPVMCAALLSPQKKPSPTPTHKTRRSKWLLFYRRSLAWALRHQWLMWLVLIAAIALNVALYRAIPKGFFPQQDTGRINGYIRADQSSSFQAMQERLHTMLAIVQADPAVLTVTGFTGEGQRNAARMFMTLKPRDQRDVSAEQVVARLRARLSKEAGARLYLTPVQDIRVGARASNSEYEFSIKADDLAQLREWEPKLRRALGKLKELEDISNDYEERGLQTTLVIDRDAASRLGLSVRAIDTVLANAFSQRQIGIIYNPLNQYRVVMELAPPYLESAESLRRLQFINDKGQAVPFTSFARIELTNTALSVSHEGGVPSDTFSFSLAPGVSLSQATQAIDQAVAQLNLPVSVRGGFAGTANAFQKSLETQPLLILFALLTLYLVLGVLYENLLHPLTILSTLPSAGLGALLTLMAMGTEFSIIAMIGVILLIGIVKKNAILMIDVALQQQRLGRSPAQAIYVAAQRRLRPILMTTAAAMLGAIPLALAFGVGAELRQPLGLAVLGGLVLSQLLTLFTTPIVFVGLEAMRRHWQGGGMKNKLAVHSYAVVVLCLSLAGCGSWFKPPASNPLPPKRMPEAFGAAQKPTLLGESVDRAWWTLFEDPVLNDLQQQLESGNINLQVLSAKVRQAQASVAGAQASLFPSVSLNAGAGRAVSAAGGTSSNSVSLGLPLTWELDVWGRIDAQTQVAKANLQASREDMALARLSAQASLVQIYIAMRTAERQQAVLELAQTAYERALTLTRYRYEAGVVSAGDVAQAESQWQSAVAQGIDVQTTRQQLSHSLSVLLGQAPAVLKMSATQALPVLPALPVLMPASLLQRRPDIRAAESRVLAAQAQLGVAQAAFFPTFSFAANLGYKSTDLASLLSASTRLWSLGPTLALSLFDGGQRQAAKDDAKAALELAALNYQQLVLTALQEVEDNLVAAHQLQAQEAAQDQALQAAQRNLRITEAQYAAGTVSYLNVVTAQASALTAQRNLLDVQSRRALAVTQLLKNLGGRWDGEVAVK